ncbi:MAG TPA: EpsI family protein [Planctomycetia bacterium]|nr:EpsI family protein [Planctomycetia bacterium]
MQAPAAKSAFRPALRTRLVIALSLFAVGAGGKLVLARQVADLRSTETPKLERPLAEFPMTLGDWRGTDLATDQKLIRDIKIDDYLERRYRHPSGEELVLWFSYSRKSMDQYHHPTVCMPGNGWQEVESQRSHLAAQMTSCDIARMYFTKREEKCFVHYWYYLIGEDPVDRTMRQLSKYARVFLRGRTNPSLTAEVFSKSPNPNQRLLDEFADLVAKEIGGWMPTGTQTFSEIGAQY